MKTLKVYRGPDGEHTTLPYHLPEGRSGNVHIERELVAKGHKLTVVSIRNSLFMGMPMSSVYTDRETTIHRLIEDGQGTWMSTLPQEIEQAQRQIRKAHGRVLVGGLGLGLVPVLLQCNPKVQSIVVIERSKDVLRLVQPHMPQRRTLVVHDDLRSYLKHAKKIGATFDWAFFDTWQATDEWAWVTQVKPLRRLAIGVIPQTHIECWNENEMLGQIELSLRTRMDIEQAPDHTAQAKFKQCHLSDRDFNKGCKNKIYEPIWPFLNWYRHVKPSMGEALAEIEDYMVCLQDAVLWQKIWRKYERVLD